MTIAYVTSHINKSLQWAWFAEGLRDAGVDQVHIVINDCEPLLLADLRRLGLTAYYLPHRGPLSHAVNLWKVWRLLRRHRVGLVHTSLPHGNLIGQVAALLAGVRARVSTCENASWGDDFGNRKHQAIDRLTYKLSRRVVAVSDSAAEYLRDRWKLGPDRLVTIYHGLKVSEFEAVGPDRIESLRRRLGLDPGDFVVGVVARFEHWKGHDDIIDAAREVVAARPEVKFVIVGSKGPEYDRLFEKIKGYGLEGSVLYKGFVDDPVALFQLFDVHVHVPINRFVENCGINIIEGMVSRRAQVLTRSGYAYTTARHLENCLVVDYRDAGQIARAVLELRDDPGLRERLGREARADAVRLFSNDVKVERHLALYRELADGRPV
jgi:glycosyltransferase involved in cell wall biosynthesis